MCARLKVRDCWKDYNPVSVYDGDVEEVEESHLLLTCDCRLRRPASTRQSQPSPYFRECFANPEKVIFNPPLPFHGTISRLVSVAPPFHPSHVQSTWRDLHSTLLEPRVTSSFHNNNTSIFTTNETEQCQRIETSNRRGINNTEPSNR